MPKRKLISFFGNHIFPQQVTYQCQSHFQGKSELQLECYTEAIKVDIVISFS